MERFLEVRFKIGGKASSSAIYFHGISDFRGLAYLESLLGRCALKLKRIRFLVALSPLLYPLTIFVLCLFFVIQSVRAAFKIGRAFLLALRQHT